MNNQRPNYQLWHLKESEFPSSNLTDQLKYLCSYGHLAPSSHNTQPWKFIIDGNHIQIHADLTHRLPAADPTNKELFISTGCTIPNIEIAARHFGFIPNTTILPNHKNPNHIATIECVASNTKPSNQANLFPYITRRLTNRSMYQKGKTLPKSIVHQLQSIPQHSIELELYQKDLLKPLAKITYDSMKAALSNQAFRDELSHWVRHNWTKQGDGLPANTLGMPDAMSVMITTLVKSPMMAITTAELEERMINSSSAVGILYAPQEEKRHWINAGRTFTLLSLICVKHKLGIAPLSGAIEIQSARQKLLRLLHETRVPMMFFRIGYPKKKFPHSPRRDLNQVITIQSS